MAQALKRFTAELATSNMENAEGVMMIIEQQLDIIGFQGRGVVDGVTMHMNDTAHT